MGDIEPRKVMTAEVFKSENATLPYRLYLPEKVKGAVPLVVFLHGLGERGDDNKAQLKHGVRSILEWLEESGTSAIVAAPQCANPGLWGDINWDTKMLRRQDQPTAQLGMVLALVDDLLKTQSVDPKRVYLTGLSMGGYGTWDAVWRRPELFAAAIPVCGGGIPQEAKAIKDLPLWVFHGGNDIVVPSEQSRRMVAAVKKAGGKPKYTEYPGVGHDSWSKTYKNDEVLKWLFEQKR